jgi:glycosyltransferase involved in cell wall biosynthesis
LLVRRSTFERVGGFDERFYPGYNEDIDLCLSIKQLGQRILYQPRSSVFHHESQTGGEAKTFLILRGRALLREKWGRALERFAEPRPHDETAKQLAVQRARGIPRRVLIVDDRLPDPRVGSGFRRMLDAMRELVHRGYAPSFYPRATPEGDRRELQDLGVEVLEGDLVAHLADPATIYDVAIVSRPHNFYAVAKLRRFQPHAAIIYDAEAVFHRRLEREAELLAGSDPEAARNIFRKAKHGERQERSIARAVDRLVSVSEVEAEFWRSVPGHCPIKVIEPLVPQTRVTARPFGQRRGMAFVAGWLARYPSPNSDGLEWFATEVLPAIRRRVPWVQLMVTGANPPDEVTALRGSSIRFLGQVEDLAELYGSITLAVVPVRYGAGIKIKALEALQHGVPVVATRIGAEGIEGTSTGAVAVADSPQQFAENVTALLEDRRRWETAREAVLQLSSRWLEAERTSWATVVETALMEKTVGGVAIHS